MRRFSFALILLVIALFACDNMTPARKGNKDFERAWRSLMLKDFAKASDYFADGAEDYAEALADKSDSRLIEFGSTQAKAGMSFYFAGRYQEAADTMKALADVEKELWEAPLFAALSHGRLGDREAFVHWLELFRANNPGLAKLNETMRATVIGLTSRTMSLEEATETLEQGVISQYIHNVRIGVTTGTIGKERCEGQYWWRFYDTPCTGR